MRVANLLHAFRCVGCQNYLFGFFESGSALIHVRFRLLAPKILGRPCGTWDQILERLFGQRIYQEFSFRFNPSIYGTMSVNLYTVGLVTTTNPTRENS
jgi:hypothetical protein